RDDALELTCAIAQPGVANAKRDENEKSDRGEDHPPKERRFCCARDNANREAGSRFVPSASSVACLDDERVLARRDFRVERRPSVADVDPRCVVWIETIAKPNVRR